MISSLYRFVCISWKKMIILMMTPMRQVLSGQSVKQVILLLVILLVIY